MIKKIKTKKDKNKSNKKNIIYGICSAIALFLAFGIPTALLPTGIFKRMTDSTMFDYAFLFIVPVLFGYFIYLYLQRRQTAKKTCAAVSGLGAGWLAVICPICVKFLVLLFGMSALMTYFDPIRPVFGVVSIVILVVLIYFIRRK